MFYLLDEFPYLISQISLAGSMERREGHEDGRGQAQMAKTGSRSLAPTLLTYWLLLHGPQPKAEPEAKRIV